MAKPSIEISNLGPIGQLRTGRLPRRIVQLFAGLWLFGFSIALMIRGNLGVAPWDVLTTGLEHWLPLSFGQITIVVSFVVLGYLGVVPTTVWGQLPKGFPMIGGDDVATWVARVLTVVYFLFFLLMPWYTKNDKELPEPERVNY